MKKTFLLFGFILAYSIIVNAQIQNLSISERTEMADLIVEGKVVAKQSFWDNNHGTIYTKNKIEVFKSFKGNAYDTIQIITRGGIVNEQIQFFSHEPEFSLSDEGIFFSKFKAIENFGSSNVLVDPKSGGFIKYYFAKQRLKAVDGTVVFTNLKTELYQQIVSQTNTNYIPKKKNTLEKGIEKWLENILDIETTTDVLIEFTFDNINLIGTDEVEFDIMAKSNQANIKFAASDIYISYSTEAFGNSVVANDKIEATKETIIENNVYTLELSDEETSIVKFLVNAGLEPNELFPLSQLAEKFLHVRLDIENIYQLATLTFEDFLMANQSFFYDETTGEFVGFDKIAVEIPVFPFLVPQIETFYPNPIPAGTGEILTIEGSNFGEFNPNISTVIFVDGDNTSNGEMSAGPKDFEWDNIVHWTQDEIKIKVPSVDRDKNVLSPASTGKIKVKNADSEISSPSQEKLNIPYSILNVRNGSFSSAFKGTVKGQNDDNICFSFNNNIPNWVRDEFESALADWCNATGVNYQLGASVSNNDLAVDGVNLVSFINQGLGAAMVVDGAYFAGICTEGEIGRIISEIDFRIFSSITNPTDDNRKQMRETIKHELGHAHMLGHANSDNGANQYLMFESGNVGAIITSNDLEGANLLFTNSQAIIQGSCGTPIGTGNCGQSCITNSTHELNSNISMTINPNPSKTKIKVQLPDFLKSSKSIKVISTIGVVLQEYDLLKNQNIIDITLPSSSGIYYIQLMIEGKVITQKIIKL